MQNTETSSNKIDCLWKLSYPQFYLNSKQYYSVSKSGHLETTLCVIVSVILLLLTSRTVTDPIFQKSIKADSTYFCQ